eukprot:3278705-Pleurochrysis_carterae.AAC.1
MVSGYMLTMLFKLCMLEQQWYKVRTGGGMLAMLMHEHPFKRSRRMRRRNSVAGVYSAYAVHLPGTKCCAAGPFK